MAFLDFFRPKHKHSSVDVRADRARELGEGDERLLAEIVRTDPEVRVRRIAVKKIQDATLLLEIAERDADDGLRHAALDHANELLLADAHGPDEAKSRTALALLKAPKLVAEVAKDAEHAAVRKEALARLTDEKLLADVAKRAGDPEIRLEALSRLTDLDAVLDVALQDATAEVSGAALHRLNAAEALAEVARRAKNRATRDKAQRRIDSHKVKEKAARPPREVSAEAKNRARALQLVGIVEKLASHVTDEDGEGEGDIASQIAAARGEFQGLHTDPALEKRFERALGQFEIRRRAKLEAAAAAAARTEKEARDLGEAATLIDALDRCDPAELNDRVAETRRAWRALGPLSGEAGKRLEELSAKLEATISALQKRAKLALSRKAVQEQALGIAVHVEQLLDPDMRPSAEKRLPQLAREWEALAAAGIDDEITARYTKARGRVDAALAEERAARAEDRAAADARLAEKLHRLDALVSAPTADDRKELEQELKQVLDAFEAQGDAISAERKEAFARTKDKVAARLAELREAENWKRWANVPRLEKLCEAAELLMEAAYKQAPIGPGGEDGTVAASSGTDMKEVAIYLKTLQAEWKATGPAPRERSEQLWGRFKAATDEVYKKVSEHFGHVDEDKAKNLTLKQELVARAEALATTIEAMEQPDWKVQSEAVKALQDEWKAIGPVAKEEADAIWKRFRAANDRFYEKRKATFDARDAERMGNLRRLEDLCAKVERLSEHAEPNWKEWAELIKGYQAEWKTIGPAPREMSEQVWQRFRGACDRFFERRKVWFEQLDSERVANLAVKEQIIAKAEELAAGEISEEKIDEIKKLQAEWKKSGHVPREQADEVWGRFRAACDKFFERLRNPDPKEDGVVEVAQAGPGGVHTADAPSPGGAMGIGGFANKINLGALLGTPAPVESKGERKRRRRDERVPGDAVPTAAVDDTTTPVPAEPAAAAPVAEAIPAIVAGPADLTKPEPSA